jgi:hypothetical protein
VVAVLLLLPVPVTVLSSAMSASGLVMIRPVNPDTAPLKVPEVMPAPKSAPSPT